ncbi:hypothetical protein [Pectinatus frisingensis]|nr:hypothetical protein [Pectinatus frisingensis]
MEKQIVECKPMKKIGFDVGGHSEYDDKVWATFAPMSRFSTK